MRLSSHKYIDLNQGFFVLSLVFVLLWQGCNAQQHKGKPNGPSKNAQTPNEPQTSEKQPDNSNRQIDGKDPISEIVFRGKSYIVVTFFPEKYALELYNEHPSGRIHTLSSVYNVIRNQNRKLVFEMNAGMFDDRGLPIGLFISNGIEKKQINLDTNGYGNFYDLPPNGVFAMDEKQRPILAQSRLYGEMTKGKKIKIATQSGPMLVIDGKFNPAFNKGSKNLNIRNGVGIDKKGRVVFVISKKEVNFYEFSELFRDQLKCNNALYLDGKISQYYSPMLAPKPMQRYRLGPIIALIEQ